MTKTTCDICQGEAGPFQRVETQVGVHPHAGKPITEHLDFCPDCLKAAALKTDEIVDELKERLASVKKVARPDILGEG